MQNTKPRFPTEKSSKPVQPIPEGFHTVTPYLTIKGAESAL